MVACGFKTGERGVILPAVSGVGAVHPCLLRSGSTVSRGLEG